MLISPTLASILDMARWVAAFVVVIGHVRSIVFLNYSTAGGNLIVKGLYFITGFGHEAVMVFFVLSGLLVGGKVVDELRAGCAFNARKYAVNRIARLYPALIIALSLGFVLDWIGLNWFNQPGLYTNEHHMDISVIRRSYADSLNLPVFVGNLFGLQTVKVMTLGSNGPLWSLANEMWYYLMGPMLAIALFGRIMLHRAAFASVLIGLLWILPTGITKPFVFWLFGAAIVLLPARGLPGFIALPWFAITLLVSRFGVFDSYLCDMLVAMSFALLIHSATRWKFRLPFPGLHQRMASFSYSLYLIHFPLIVLIVSIGQSWNRPMLQLPVAMYGVGISIALLIAAYLASYGVASISEFRTDAVRRRLMNCMGQNPKTAATPLIKQA